MRFAQIIAARCLSKEASPGRHSPNNRRVAWDGFHTVQVTEGFCPEEVFRGVLRRSRRTHFQGLFVFGNSGFQNHNNCMNLICGMNFENLV
ncbi:hypothetical protein CDAR_386411 [Caerostris darwini]|uniref:Uncharacterized protein n=1 Tax=Caerostris darwini TaxID=1538125 RepID=A0AAV4QDK5_9ARAC|nr:hypothetical protein CDAR_386411 [Caerostris darwini]